MGLRAPPVCYFTCGVMEVNVEGMTVAELKIWLKARGKSTKGRKSDLIDRYKLKTKFA